MTKITFLRETSVWIGIIIILSTLASCTKQVERLNANEIPRNPKIYPDYNDIMIPPNIAPMNFSIKEKADKYCIDFSADKGKNFRIIQDNPDIKIPRREWHILLSKNTGKKITITVYIMDEKGNWSTFRPITNSVTEEKVDKYLVYRLLDHGYSYWENMGIYQRDLESFREKAIITNRTTGKGCINCHSFKMNNPDNMLIHLRAGKTGGTLILHDGVLEKVATRAGEFRPAVYPYWHPSGKFISFSVNNILQCFHMAGKKRIEVFDFVSDLIFYDVQKHEITNPEMISQKDKLETYPAWAPDGRRLYFCRAHQPDNLLNRYETEFDSINYDLMSIGFNPDSKQWGSLDTIISADSIGKSVTLPRVSPDGKYLLFCMVDYGIFSIQHPESDLYMLNVSTGEYKVLSINSEETESYHSWSSNSRWIVFSSKREDGVYARPYFSYIDEGGNAHKPFLLPQKNPNFYKTFLKTYNIPELNMDKVKISSWKLTRKAYSRAIDSKFVHKH